ncbi:MAG: RdgB/HAM1 family non-canonical purine NTP pyrophosphatase [Oscillospiraceae bacterium]|nr:RdgB/HAM1 family non-canonical purine NTP pyrophosphatase [Oscillospiraceae bacterium]
MKLVLASDNAHKLAEFKELFRTLDTELVSKAESGAAGEVEETGVTFAENAFIKAEAVMRAAGLPAIADDSGLCVDALGGDPGVRSARYTGRHEDSDADRYRLLLNNLGDRKDRSARFVCSLCCVFPNGDVLRAEGTCEGTILFAPQGENGFGYDPVFRPEGCDCSMAELTMEQKNAISHRGKALKQFKEEWVKYYADK